LVQRTTLNWPESFAGILLLAERWFSESSKSEKGCAMPVALEISFALWIMIGCATAEAIRLAEYLN
jgi:hypothetical protein